MNQTESELFEETGASHLTGDLMVGRLPFLISAPYFCRSINGLSNVQFLDGTPAELAQALLQGEIDCAPVSSIEYAMNAEDYLIVPGLATHGRSKIKSEVFLSRVPWERINGLNVLLSPASPTSNILFQTLCRKRYEVDPIFNIPAEPIGRIVVGNEALSMAYNSSWEFCYDLSEEWYKWQSLPFTFGLWMVRKSVIGLKKKILETYLDYLEETKKSFFDAPEACVQEWVGRYPADLPERIIRGFFESDDYHLTPMHEKSILLFFKMTAEMGYTTPCPTLHFLDLKDS